MIRLVAFALALVVSNAFANQLTGHVVSVVDGDTLTVLDTQKRQHKIRLAGIDAPEKKQPFGDRSKQSLAALTFNKLVIVDWNTIDRYGRAIGKVKVGSIDVNLEQVRTGMAWWYERYRREQSLADQKDYSEAEQMAKTHQRGLWQEHSPVPPWDWRKLRK